MGYTVLLRRVNGRFAAWVPGLPECAAEGRTREETIPNVSAAIRSALQDTEVLTVEVGVPPSTDGEDPWIRGFGMLRDDPDHEEVQQEIAAFRQQVDEAPPPALP